MCGLYGMKQVFDSPGWFSTFLALNLQIVLEKSIAIKYSVPTLHNFVNVVRNQNTFHSILVYFM